MERWQENSFVDASSKFLLALEILSDTNLTSEKLQVACNYLSIIDERAFTRQAELRTELYFWRGECARLHSEFGPALQQYEKAIRTSYKGEIRQLALLRIAEIADRLSNYETALSAYDNLASTSGNSLALEASLRRAALLYRIARLDSARVELQRSKRIYDGKTTSSSVVAEVISSPFQEVLSGNQDPSAWYFEFDIPPSPENEKLFVRASTPARIALIEGSTLTEQKLYDSAIAVFDRGIQFIASTKDSTFVPGEKAYYRDGLAFEKAWAFFRKGSYTESADLFYAIALRDSAQKMVSAPARSQRRFADPFYEELQSDGSSMSESRLNPLDAQLREFYFNDFPPRARYYAGIAYARAGQSQKALQLLTELSQNKNIVYSERSSFYRGLLEFQNSRMYQAEVLLEPLGLRRTVIGAYASLLLGDIYYRRASYARAAEYLDFALQYLPQTDVALRSRAQLELGLSLIPLGSWQRASIALQEYLEHADQQTIANDEALFWLGRAYYRSDSILQARKTFERLLLEYPNSERFIDAQYTYAWTLLRQGEFSGAATAFAEVVRKDTITRYAYDALSRQGDALYALGDLPQALAIYNKAVDRPTFNNYLESRAMFQLGVTRLKSDSSRSAINAFNYIINKIAGSDLIDRSYYNLALAAYAIRLDDRARDAITQLEKNFPASPFASRGALLAAEELERNGHDAAALQEYRRILTTYPATEEFETALFNTIELLARTKKYQDAIELIESYLGKPDISQTNLSRLTIRKAELALEASKPQSSVQTLKAFIAANPQDAFIPNANYTLGKAYNADGSVDSSIAQFQYVITSYPESDAAPYSYLQLARIEAKRQHNETAAGYYTKAFDWKFYSSDAAPTAMAEYAAFVRNTLSLPDSAIKVYDDLISRYLIETSAGTNAQLEVVEMLLEKDRTTEAASRLQTIAIARKGERSSGEARLKLANLYRKQSATKKALTEYDKARKENSLTPDQTGRSLLGSAEMHLMLGDKRSAKTVLQELMSKRGIARQYRIQAEQMLEKIAPKKKAPKKGKR
jgi:TolA-binding protein